MATVFECCFTYSGRPKNNEYDIWDKSINTIQVEFVFLNQYKDLDGKVTNCQLLLFWIPYYYSIATIIVLYIHTSFMMRGGDGLSPSKGIIWHVWKQYTVQSIFLLRKAR